MAADLGRACCVYGRSVCLKPAAGSRFLTGVVCSSVKDKSVGLGTFHASNWLLIDFLCFYLGWVEDFASCQIRLLLLYVGYKVPSACRYGPITYIRLRYILKKIFISEFDPFLFLKKKMDERDGRHAHARCGDQPSNLILMSLFFLFNSRGTISILVRGGFLIANRTLCNHREEKKGKICSFIRVVRISRLALVKQ